MKYTNASRLYWYTGVGWISTFFSVVLMFSLYFTKGFTFYVILVILILWLLLQVFRIYYWNFPKWKRIHGRSMLVFAGLLGKEDAESKLQDREFDIYEPLENLAKIMIHNNNFYEATSMLFNVMNKEGTIYFEYLNEHIRFIFPNISETTIIELELELKEFPVTAHMIIIQLINSRYGSLEAAKYALAVYKGEAK